MFTTIHHWQRDDCTFEICGDNFCLALPEHNQIVVINIEEAKNQARMNGGQFSSKGAEGRKVIEMGDFLTRINLSGKTFWIEGCQPLLALYSDEKLDEEGIKKATGLMQLKVGNKLLLCDLALTNDGGQGPCVIQEISATDRLMDPYTHVETGLRISTVSSAAEADDTLKKETIEGNQAGSLYSVKKYVGSKSGA